MKKTWIFFKLRMLQLKSDKTALFFSYVFPVLLLLGVGYPLSINDKPQIELYYWDQVDSDATRTLLSHLKEEPLLKLIQYNGDPQSVVKKIEANEIKHHLYIHRPVGEKAVWYQIENNSLDDNLIENSALVGMFRTYLNNEGGVLKTKLIKSQQHTSYIVTLLPGLIGMTLLIIGLNGFGNVLIEEEHKGLYKNIKTIDVSPGPFLSGLFLSRVLVCYTVAAALFLIGVSVFKMSADIHYPLFILIISIGSFAFLGLGLMIATLSPSVSAFNGIVNFVQLPLIALGGVFFSISAFPQWVKAISECMPLTSMNMALQKVIFDSVSFRNITEISRELAVLVLWCLITVAVSRKRFRWRRGE